MALVSKEAQADSNATHQPPSNLSNNATFFSNTLSNNAASFSHHLILLQATIKGCLQPWSQLIASRHCLTMTHHVSCTPLLPSLTKACPFPPSPALLQATIKDLQSLQCRPWSQPFQLASKIMNDSPRQSIPTVVRKFLSISPSPGAPCCRQPSGTCRPWSQPSAPRGHRWGRHPALLRPRRLRSKRHRRRKRQRRPLLPKGPKVSGRSCPPWQRRRLLVSGSFRHSPAPPSPKQLLPRWGWPSQGRVRRPSPTTLTVLSSVGMVGIRVTVV